MKSKGKSREWGGGDVARVEEQEQGSERNKE